MRYLITIVIAALSLNAFGQGIPQLPYNPDENGDGLIGVPDLQALLSQYGLEFNSAVLSDDEESAIVYMGEMAHPVCNLACDNLPGFWHMSTMNDLALVWDEVAGNTWINSDKFSINTGNSSEGYLGAFSYYRSSDPNLFYTSNPSATFRCYCAANELPKVEYSYCEGVVNYDASLSACLEEKKIEGWYPLAPISPGWSTYSQDPRLYQAFWRWAAE